MNDDVQILLHFIRDRAVVVHTVYHKANGKVPMAQCPMALCKETRRVLEAYGVA